MRGYTQGEHKCAINMQVHYDLYKDAFDKLVVPLYSGERSTGTSYSVAATKLWNSSYQ